MYGLDMGHWRPEGPRGHRQPPELSGGAWTTPRLRVRRSRATATKVSTAGAADALASPGVRDQRPGTAADRTDSGVCPLHPPRFPGTGIWRSSSWLCHDKGTDDQHLLGVHARGPDRATTRPTAATATASPHGILPTAQATGAPHRQDPGRTRPQEALPAKTQLTARVLANAHDATAGR